MGALRDVSGHVIDIYEKKQWPEDCSLGDARENLCRSRPLPIHNDTHASACQEGPNPGVHGSLDTMVSQVAEETLMRHGVESPTKVQYADIRLLLLVEVVKEVQGNK